MGEHVLMRALEAVEKAATTARTIGVSYSAARTLEFLLLQTRPTAWWYWRVAPDVYRWRYGRRLREYDAPLDPFKIEEVSPASVHRYSGIDQPYQARKELFGAVENGGWDRRQVVSDSESDRRYEELFLGESFDESLFHTSMEAHFLGGVPWEETSFVRTVLRFVETGPPIWHGCTSREDVIDRCRALDELYGTIASEGYESRMNCRRRRPRFDEPFGFLGRVCDEVIVDIGRDGELLLADGRHRLSIAKLLDLESIPVAFVVRHEEWMATREAVFRGEVTPQRPIHPDLREILST